MDLDLGRFSAPVLESVLVRFPFSAFPLFSYFLTLVVLFIYLLLRKVCAKNRSSIGGLLPRPYSWVLSLSRRPPFGWQVNSCFLFLLISLPLQASLLFSP